jgi:hypothetical protein
MRLQPAWPSCERSQNPQPQSSWAASFIRSAGEAGQRAGVSKVVHVPHQGVANAVGAAIAQVSGEVDQVFQNLSREQALERARRLAADPATQAGAAAAISVVEEEDIPLSYLPGNSLRVRVRVVGDIAGA